MTAIPDRTRATRAREFFELHQRIQDHCHRVSTVRRSTRAPNTSVR